MNIHSHLPVSKPSIPTDFKFVLMKTKVLILLMLLVATFSHAQPNPPEFPRAVIVIIEDPENNRLKAEEVYLMAVTQTQVAYKFNAADAEPEVKKRTEIDSIFLYDPKDYLEALDLFEARKYAEAKDAFAAVYKRYGRAYPGIPNNPGVMAGFYELECLRKLMDLEGLRVALQSYKKDGLTNKVALQQLEVYVLWDAIRANLNQEAIKIAENYKGKRLPGHQRAQIAYCHGRALEGLKRPPHEILLAYQTALTADAGNSEIIARDAALRSLAILDKDQEMKDAIRTFDESDGQEMIRGFTKAMEAAGLCQMFQIQLGAGEPLPAKYRYFLKYTPDIVQKAAEGGGGEEEKKDGE